jgi:hypothetical protein
MKDGFLRNLTTEVGNSTSVASLLIPPRRARACFVFAHGAGICVAEKFRCVPMSHIAKLVI